MPVPSATRNAPSPPLRAVAPVTVNVSPTVANPVTARSPTLKSSPIVMSSTTPPVTTKAPVVELVDAVPEVTAVSPLNVVAPVTVASPEALKVVNEPEAVVDPIEVPSIAPPLISTLDKVEVPVAVRSVRVDSPVTSKAPVTVASPEALKVVNEPEAVVDPIEVPSIAPPLISTVDKVAPVAVRSVKLILL